MEKLKPSRNELLDEIRFLKKRIIGLETILANSYLSRQTVDEYTDTLIKHLSDIVFIINQDNTIKYETPTSAKILGYSPGYLIGKNSLDLVHPEDLDRVLHDLGQVLEKQNEYEPTEFRVRHANGNWIYLETMAHNMLDHEDIQGIVITARVITERKLAEEALRSSEQRFRMIFDHLNDAIFILDTQQGAILDVNQTMCELFGYTRDEARMIDINKISSGEPPYTLPDALLWIRKARESGPQIFEWVGRERSGRLFPVEVNMRLAQIDGMQRILMMMRDISERKQADNRMQRLLDQQIIVNQLALVLGQSTDLDQIYQMIYERVRTLIDADGFIVSFFDEDADQFYAGYVVMDEISQNIHQIPPLQVKRESPGMQSRVLITGQPLLISDYSQIRRQLHTIQTIQPHGINIRDNLGQTNEREFQSMILVPMKVSGEVIGIMQAQSYRLDAYSQDDITLLTGLANIAAIAIQNARLILETRAQALHVQHIINSVPEGVLLIDTDYSINLTNPAAERYLRELARTKPDEPLTQLGDQPLQDLLEQPPRGLWHEIHSNHHIFEFIAQPLETGPSPGGWVLVIRDVTQQRQNERHIQQQDRLATVGQLAAGIAHDFNNIMATIILYTEMLTQSPEMSNRDQERLSTIHQQSQHASNLIRQIMDFSRKSVLERRPLYLTPLLKEQAKLLERTFPENIQVKFTAGPDDYIISADPTRIQQVIMNLALNSRDAMVNGGSLNIHLDRIHVDPGVTPPLLGMIPGDWVRLIVSDTGSGFTPDALSHIFEPFFSTKPPGEGTGLGLAQVYGIIAQHDGLIDVKTQNGRGTTFTIFLPALQTQSSTSDKTRIDALEKGHGELILVVEDNVSTRMALVDSLEILDYRTLTAPNGREALKLFDQYGDQISLVLTDVIMPHLGGIALVKEVQNRKLPVKSLIITGHSPGLEMQTILDDEQLEWLTKPISLEQLSRSVSRLINAGVSQ